ncbi:hypothetical protein D1007_60132 [Hordeum vulgare]|nr:hypothetical protein D1007_60132 [Hordeum vulgare]
MYVLPTYSLKKKLKEKGMRLLIKTLPQTTRVQPNQPSLSKSNQIKSSIPRPEKEKEHRSFPTKRYAAQRRGTMEASGISGGTAEAGRPPHVAMLSTPGMGHLIPLAELAKRLAARHGATATLITFASTASATQRGFLLPPAAHLLALPPARRPLRPAARRLHRDAHVRGVRAVGAGADRGPLGAQGHHAARGLLRRPLRGRLLRRRRGRRRAEEVPLLPREPPGAHAHPPPPGAGRLHARRVPRPGRARQAPRLRAHPGGGHPLAAAGQVEPELPVDGAPRRALPRGRRHPRQLLRRPGAGRRQGARPPGARPPPGVQHRSDHTDRRRRPRAARRLPGLARPAAGEIGRLRLVRLRRVAPDGADAGAGAGAGAERAAVPVGGAEPERRGRRERQLLRRGEQEGPPRLPPGGVRGEEQGRRPTGAVVGAADGGAGARGHGVLPGALRVELGAGEPRARRAHGRLAALRRAAAERRDALGGCRGRRPSAGDEEEGGDCRGREGGDGGARQRRRGQSEGGDVAEGGH